MNGCKNFGLMVLTLTVGGLGAVAWGEVNVGDQPRLSLKTLEGKTIRSDDLDGQIVILDFWATWCGPCVREVPHLKKVHARYRKKGVTLISITQDRKATTAIKFIRQHKMKWAHVHDRTQRPKLGRAFGVSGIPKVFILSPDGEVLWRGHPAQMDKPLAEFMKSHPPRANNNQAKSKLRTQGIRSVMSAREALRGNEPDFAKMLSRLASVPSRVRDDQRVRAAARGLSLRLRSVKEQQDQLQAAREANPEAAAILDELTAPAKLRRSAREGDETKPADSRTRQPKQPAELLAAKLEKADAARKAGDHALAFKTYMWLVDHALDTDLGAVADLRLGEYESNEKLMTDINESLSEAKARSLLQMARNYDAADKPDAARQLYRQIIDEYPQSECCAQAREAIQ